jgi:formylglycine-generating enzyme required for sulfatase activity
MGADKHYPEEAPAHRVTVGNFRINRTPVTLDNSASASTKPATSLPDAKDYPGALPLMLKITEPNDWMKK